MAVIMVNDVRAIFFTGELNRKVELNRIGSEKLKAPEQNKPQLPAIKP